MKKYFALLVFASALTFSTDLFSRDKSEINEKAIKAFNQVFPLAENVQWQEFSDRIMAHFEDGNIRTIVNYDKDGNFLDATRYYKSRNLPVNILYKIRKVYPDKNIFGVTEIFTESDIAYYIKLEDDKNWITLKADPTGVFEIVEKFKKQS